MKNLLWMIAVFFCICTSAQASILELQTDKTQYLVGERPAVIVFVNDSGLSYADEYVMTSTVQSNSLRMQKLSEKYFAAVASPLVGVGTHIWEVKLYTQDKAISEFKEHQIFELEEKIIALRVLYDKETDSTKKANLTSAIQVHRNQIDVLKASILSGRTLVETKQINLTVVASPLHMTVPFTIVTGKPYDTFTLGEGGPVNFDILTAQIPGYQLLTFHFKVHFDSVQIATTKPGQYSYRSNLTVPMLTLGSHSLQVSLYARNYDRAALYEGATDAAAIYLVKLQDLQDATLNSSLKQFYQSEIDDLNKILEVLYQAYRELDTLVATDTLAITVSATPPPIYTAIAVGANTSCGIRDGGLFCWGKNEYGSLGVGDLVSRSVPTAVPGFSSGVTSVTVGEHHVCAIKSSLLYCWGRNNKGQIGDGTLVDKSSPVLISLSSVTKVSAGAQHTCAVDSGSGYCWGDNARGALGDGSNTDSSSPVAISGGRTMTDISAGNSFSCGISDLGSGLCWGANTYGQLGNLSNTDTNTPVQAFGKSSGVQALVAGDASTCSIAWDYLQCWGLNSDGQLGIGNTTDQNSGSMVSGFGPYATKVSVGKTSACTVHNGKTWCWGKGTGGALGNGASSSSTIPVEVTGLGTSIAGISVGDEFACGIQAGVAKCWGVNQSGSLGNGSLVTGQSSPVAVELPAFIERTGRVF
ncbi:Regulator of chromosome condensation (RCC1) repeat protein [compost metagenome]